MTGPIIVINPNSNEAVTEAMDQAVDCLRIEGGPPIECVTLTEGPFGIESQRDSDAVVMPLAAIVEQREDAQAFVIACYSDPGIDVCRSVAKVPVFGIQESGILTAMTRGDLFGIIAISDVSIARHTRYMRRMGVLERLANERALNMSVDDTARGENTLSRLIETGNQLRGDGADVIVLGCAGMARHRKPVEGALGIPVIDPVQAAVSMALGATLIRA